MTSRNLGQVRRVEKAGLNEESAKEVGLAPLEELETEKEDDGGKDWAGLFLMGFSG